MFTSLFFSGWGVTPGGAGRKAAFYEMPALAINHDNLAVGFFMIFAQGRIKPLQGAEVTLEKEYHLVLGPASGSNLCHFSPGLTWITPGQPPDFPCSLKICRGDHCPFRLPAGRDLFFFQRRYRKHWRKPALICSGRKIST